jgi:hypothetical protein
MRKIIDTHMHFSKLKSFDAAAAESGELYTAEGLKRRLDRSNIQKALLLGIEESAYGLFPDKKAPLVMLPDLLDFEDARLFHCIGINPYRLPEPDAGKLIEEALIHKRCRGIKIYPGYYPFTPASDIYFPVYSIAEKFEVPVIFHMGDTYSETANVKYAHPLAVDEAAVAFRKVNFVIAHMGEPWLMDAAEVMYKNHNVYADLSGILTGAGSYVRTKRKQRFLLDRFKTAIAFMEDYSRLLFGSDWPLASYEEYTAFVSSLIPQKHREKVFFSNAFNLFRLE